MEMTPANHHQNTIPTKNIDDDTSVKHSSSVEGISFSSSSHRSLIEHSWLCINLFGNRIQGVYKRLFHDSNNSQATIYTDGNNHINSNTNNNNSTTPIDETITIHLQIDGGEQLETPTDINNEPDITIYSNGFKLAKLVTEISIILFAIVLLLLVILIVVLQDASVIMKSYDIIPKILFMTGLTVTLLSLCKRFICKPLDRMLLNNWIWEPKIKSDTVDENKQESAHVELVHDQHQQEDMDDLYDDSLTSVTSSLISQTQLNHNDYIMIKSQRIAYMREQMLSKQQSTSLNVSGRDGDTTNMHVRYETIGNMNNENGVHFTTIKGPRSRALRDQECYRCNNKPPVSDLCGSGTNVNVQSNSVGDNLRNATINTRSNQQVDRPTNKSKSSIIGAESSLINAPDIEPGMKGTSSATQHAQQSFPDGKSVIQTTILPEQQYISNIVEKKSLSKSQKPAKNGPHNSNQPTDLDRVSIENNRRALNDTSRNAKTNGKRVDFKLPQ